MTPIAPPQWDHAANARQHHYDLLSTGSTVMMLTSNVLRSSVATTSYDTASTEQALRLTQAAFTVSMAVHLMCLWLLLHRPQLHYHMRTPIVCIRWLSVSSIVVASTGLPVFQAGAAAASSSWWLSRCFGMCFRAGLTFCVIAFAFYHMPWRYMAAVAFVYAACNSLTTPGYCRSAMAMHSGLRPHADFSVLQRAAVVLDTLVGQGQQQQPLQQQLPQETDLQHVTAAGGGAGGGADSPWEATASLLLAACSADVLQDNPAKQQACHHALVGQCQATLCTLNFGISYLMVLIMISLERYNKWRYLKQQQLSNAANSNSTGAGPALGPGFNPHPGNSNSTSSYSHGSQQGLLASHYQAPTAWAFLRVELLGLLVLADVPVLVLYWLLSLVLRPDVASLQTVH